MSGIVGGNLEQMHALEAQFRTEAHTVGELERRIARLLSGTAWTGPAAERFRDEWFGSFSPSLARLCEALAHNADVVRSRRDAIQTATY